MEIRSYRPEDAPACLAVFGSNNPPFFMPSERDEFASFLAEEEVRHDGYGPGLDDERLRLSLS